MNERRKYLRLIRERHLKAPKLERGRLLNDMEAITRLDRKSLIRLMSGNLERKPRHKQRGRRRLRAAYEVGRCARPTVDTVKMAAERRVGYNETGRRHKKC